MCVEAFRMRGNSPTPWGRGRPCRRVRDLLMTRCARRGVGGLGRRGGEYLDLGSPKPGARPAEPRPALPPGARPGLGRERFGPLGSRASRDALAVAGTRLGRRWLSPSPAPLPPASRAPPAPGTGRLTSSRDGDSARAPGGGGSSLGRTRRGHRSRRRRRGHKSGGVNLGARSPQPRTHRAPAGAGGDAHLGQRSSPPVFAALAGPSDPRAPTWDRGSSRSRPEWKEGRGVKAISLLPGVAALGAAQPGNFPPRGKAASSPLFSAAPHRPSPPLHLTPWDSRTSDKVLRTIWLPQTLV
ncbi:hypothetical protein EI555_020485, partial [Monodon monoceros]